MTFLAPGFFYASLAVAAVVTGLHFIVTRQPRAAFLPTARFVPDMPAIATARATRPSDLFLLLLRILLVLAAGAGLAKPVIKPSRSAHARVILADVSRSVDDAGALRDSVRAVYRDGDVIVAFDSATSVVENIDSLLVLEPSQARGNLSAALVAAMRAGSSLRERADSIELVVVSPLSADEVDAATDSARSLWPGRAKVIVAGLGPTNVPENTESVSIRASAADPLAITVGRVARTNGGSIVRDGSTSISGGSAVIHWPAAARPPRAAVRPGRDTLGGVIAGDVVVISAFERRWSYPPDSIRGAEVVARWIDGEPAALEWTSESGCSRSVGVPVNPVGDLVIRSDFTRLVAHLAQPCIGGRRLVPVDQTVLQMLQRAGGLAPREAFLPRGDASSWLAPWLLGLALILSVVEIFARRRRADSVTADNRNTSDLASAA